MEKNTYFKLPRLYSVKNLDGKSKIELGAEQTHYLKNVMRLKVGDNIRLFDGQSGEYLCTIESLEKKSTTLTIKKQIAVQPNDQRAIHFLFAPIKKQRQDWMIEKMVELGVTDFHPVLTQNTEVRKINPERLERQIFEAAEQCERFTIPRLHEIEKLDKKLAQWDQGTLIYAGLERFAASQPNAVSDDFAFIIGPEGGFTEAEKYTIAKSTTPIDLGDTILRCETAAIKALILLSGKI